MTAPQWNKPPPVPSGPSLVNHVGDLVAVQFHHADRDVMVQGQAKQGVTISWFVLDGRTKGERQIEFTLTNVMVVRQLEKAEPGSLFFARVGQKSTGGPNPAVFLDDPWPSDTPTIEAFLRARQQYRANGVPSDMPPAAPPPREEPEQQQGFTEEPPF